MNAKSNTYPGLCTACGTTVDAGVGTVEKVNGKWAISHTDCAPTALTADEVATLFPSITSGQLHHILAVNLTEDEIDDATGIINQAGLNVIAQVVANNTAYEARMAAMAAKAMAQYALLSCSREA